MPTCTGTTSEGRPCARHVAEAGASCGVCNGGRVTAGATAVPVGAMAAVATTDPFAAPAGPDPYEPPTHSATPAAFDYRSETYTPDGMVEQLIREQRLSPGARGMAAGDAISQMAEAEALDDLEQGDSEQFPQTRFNDQLDHGDAIIDADGRYTTIDLGLDD